MNDSIFVGLDVHKATISVAVTDGMRGGEVRNLGSSPIALIRSTSWRRKLGKGNRQVSFCYEAGPCGYGLHRQLKGLGHNCIVAAPSLILIKAWDRVKTDRRNGAMLAKLHRCGELTAVWVPDAAHEAMPDLARATAMRVLRQGAATSPRLPAPDMGASMPARKDGLWLIVAGSPHCASITRRAKAAGTSRGLLHHAWLK